MARSVSWLPRLHEIRRSVENSVRSHYDRRALEVLFKLQPRAAGKLLSLLRTGSPLGSSHLVERETLRKFLEAASEAENVTALVLTQRLEKEKVTHRQPRLLVRRDLDPVGLAALPSWITLTRGHAHFSFETNLQLAEGLFLVVQMIDSDFPGFAAAYQPQKPSTDAPEAAAEMRVLFDDLKRREGTHG